MADTSENTAANTQVPEEEKKHDVEYADEAGQGSVS